MIFYTTIRIPNRPKRYARESQGQFDSRPVGIKNLQSP